MVQNVVKGGWDAFLFGIPLIALLVFGFFRLDQVFTARKPTQSRRPEPPGGRPVRSMQSDPDGRPWDDQPRLRRRQKHRPV